MAEAKKQIQIKTPRRVDAWRRFDQLARWISRTGSMRSLLVLTVLILISVSFTVFTLQQSVSSWMRFWLALLLLIDLALILAFAGILTLGIIRLTRGRRQQAGPLQRRLVMFFVLMAVGPILLMALFSTLTLNLGIEGWFSNQVQSAVAYSYETALAYEDEHRQLLKRDGDEIYNALEERTQLVANYSNGRSLAADYSKGRLREILDSAIEQSVNISHAFIIDGDRQIYARGVKSYLFDYVPPSTSDIEAAHQDETVIIEDRENNEFRYLRRIGIPGMGLNKYLFVTRPVDGSILALLDQTEQTALFYQNLEASRLRITMLYAALYLVISLVILSIAISAALYLARRLTRPIHQLVHAVARMSAGEMDVRVPVGSDQDELNLLSTGFNEMTAEVQHKQTQLREAGELSERERQRFNSVLEGVSSGVIGVDANDLVTFINPAALRILNLENFKAESTLSSIAPEFQPLIEEARKSRENFVQSQVILIRGGTQETLFLRVARRNEEDGLIVSFDDVSNLVEAQRMAAWGDVARRIAHEIKNPLTPIRLSAERMQRRYSEQIEDDKFSEMTQIIIRQTEDLRRIVDEFSRFSRMPDPKLQKGNLVKIVKDSITLLDQNEQVEIQYKGPEEVLAQFDPSLMGQAFSNLIKNAIEAIEALPEQEREQGGRIDILAEVKTDKLGDYLDMKIIDNGIGLPEQKSKLFEPYMTMKETGTGLGLPIVKKIVEDHSGQMSIGDRDDGKRGAQVSIRMPILNNSN